MELKPTPSVREIPALRITQSINREAKDALRYRNRKDRDNPHVVKLSGGRSSAMLLFILLENKILNAARGDIVVFNNTSAEHPATYRFVRQCFNASKTYGIPCFVNEFQTYEGMHRNEWTRIPSYRLANTYPKWEGNPNGLHWRGEVFEEMMSWAGFVPNRFRRTCTKQLKLEVTRRLLGDWLSGKEGLERLGHHGVNPKINTEAMHARHLSHRGQVPKEIYIAKRAYAWRRPHVREAQRFDAFVNNGISRVHLDPNHNRRFGPDGIEYVSLIGIRAEEDYRLAKIGARSSEGSGNAGEAIYCPLAEMGITKEDVGVFWNAQDFDLELEHNTKRSNCVYCFMKGWAPLTQVHHAQRNDGLHDHEFGDLRGTPSDLQWWRRMGRTYERDYAAQDTTRAQGTTNIGWFGKGECTYEKLERSTKVEEMDATGQPCECTD